MAAAALDRLLHRSTVINITGESYRLREKRRKRTYPFGEPQVLAFSFGVAFLLALVLGPAAFLLPELVDAPAVLGMRGEPGGWPGQLPSWPGREATRGCGENSPRMNTLASPERLFHASVPTLVESGVETRCSGSIESYSIAEPELPLGHFPLGAHRGVAHL